MSRSAEKVRNLQIFLLPPLLSKACIIPSSAGDYMLWPLFTLFYHSQGTEQILQEHLVFFLPVDPLYAYHPSPSWWLCVSSQYIGTHFTRTPRSHTQQYPRIPYQATHSHHTPLRTIESNRNQGTKHLPSKDRTRYQHRELRSPQTCLDTIIKAQSVRARTICLH